MPICICNSMARSEIWDKINFTSVVVRMAKIARGEAECNFAILTTTQVKFIPKFHS